jgi:hypothetical protein
VDAGDGKCSLLMRDEVLVFEMTSGWLMFVIAERNRSSLTSISGYHYHQVLVYTTGILLLPLVLEESFVCAFTGTRHRRSGRPALLLLALQNLTAAFLFNGY